MDTPVSDTPKLDGADSASFSDRARQPLRKIGAVIVSIAAVGAVVGGLSGYWNFWKTVKTDLFHESQVGGKSAKTAISSGLIVSKGPSVAVLPVTNPAKATALEPTDARSLAQIDTRPDGAALKERGLTPACGFRLDEFRFDKWLEGVADGEVAKEIEAEPVQVRINRQRFTLAIGGAIPPVHVAVRRKTDARAGFPGQRSVRLE